MPSRQQQQIQDTITSICGYMGSMISAKGTQAAALRQQIGDLNANGLVYLQQKIFGTMMYNCFVTIRTIPITASQVAVMRGQISSLQPTYLTSILIVDSAIQYCLTTESILITQMTFTSKQDVLDLMKKMKIAFDAARDAAADYMDSATYQNLTYLAGSLINYLNQIALQLPQIVNFSYQTNYPSLTLANLIYQDASRCEELIAENKVVHPLFMPRDIVGLSS